MKHSDAILFSLLATIFSVFFSNYSWAMSEGCEAANRGAYNPGLSSGSAVFDPYNFVAGEILTFNFTHGSGKVTIIDLSYGINLTINGRPSSPINYIIPATGPRIFLYKVAPTFPDNKIVAFFVVTCNQAAGGSNAQGSNAQNDLIRIVNRQSSYLGELINRNVNNLTNDEMINIKNFTERMAVKNTSLGWQEINKYTGMSTWKNANEDSRYNLETDNLAVAMNAAAQESIEVLNKVLRTVSLGQYFIFADVSGVLTIDDRSSRERTGKTFGGSAGFGYRYDEHWTYGLAGDYRDSDQPLGANSGETEVTSFLINPYISFKSANGLLWTVNGGYGWQENTLITDISTTTHFNSWQSNISGSVQGNWRTSAFILNPRGSLIYNFVEVQGFTEITGITTTNKTETTGAIKFNLAFISDGFEITPNIRLLPFLDLGFEWAFERPDSFLLANGTTYKSKTVTGDFKGGIQLIDRNNLELLLQGGYSQIGGKDIQEIHFGAQFSSNF